MVIVVSRNVRTNFHGGGKEKGIQRRFASPMRSSLRCRGGEYVKEIEIGVAVRRTAKERHGGRRISCICVVQDEGDDSREEMEVARSRFAAFLESRANCRRLAFGFRNHANFLPIVVCRESVRAQKLTMHCSTCE